MAVSARFLFMPAAALWLILLAFLAFVQLPVVDGRALSALGSLPPLTNTTGDLTDFLHNLIPEIPKLSCDINVCELEPELCEGALTEDGDVNRDGNIEARRTYQAQFTSGTTLSITAQDYPSRGQLFQGEAGNQVLRVAFEPVKSEDCGTVNVDAFPIAENTAEPPPNTATEHIIELQSIPRWMEDATTKPDEDTEPAVQESCFTNFWTSDSLPNDVPVMNPNPKLNNLRPNDRVFEAMGSNDNRKVLVLCNANVNRVKARIWRYGAPWGKDTVATWFGKAADSDDNASRALSMIGEVYMVLSYLNQEDVRKRMWQVVYGISEQLEIIESNLPEECVGLKTSWNDYIKGHLQGMVDDTHDWLNMERDTLQQAFTDALQFDPENQDLLERSSKVTNIYISLRSRDESFIKYPERP